MMMAVALVMATGCSDDNEPDDQYVSDFLNAIEILYNQEGQPNFTPTTTNGLYLAWAGDAGEVQKFIIRLTGNGKWTNTSDYTMNEDENGYLIVKATTPEMLSDGIFNEIIVNFSSDRYVPFTLQIITAEKAKDYMNGGPAHDGISGGGVVRLP